MNTTYIDQKYIRFLSGRLRNFKDKGNGTFEFSHRCESPTSRKRRGYFYKKGTGYNFFCHNCQASQKFFNFLKDEDPGLYKDYRTDIFKENMSTNTRENIEEVAPKETKPTPKVNYIDGLIPYSSLREDHPALKYVQKRKIPISFYNDLYLCVNFYPWAAKFNRAFEKVTIKEPRLVMPYRNRLGDVVAFTCRAFGKSDLKYIEIKLDDEAELIFGLNRINFSKTIYVLEGPIDSMFIDNAVAVGGASYHGDFFNKYKENLVVVPDNDWKRNTHVLGQIEKLANDGYKVALLPDSFRFKDVNEAIVKGIPKDDIMDMIGASIKSGAALLLEIAFRRKC